MDGRTVREFLAHFENHHWRGQSIDGRRGYRNSLARFAAFLQREPEFADFISETFQEFERWLQLKVATATRRSTIGKLRTIWRAAHSDGLVPSGPPAISQSRCGLPRALPDGSKVRVFKPFTDADLRAVHLSEKPPATLREFLPRYVSERGVRDRTAATIHHRLTNFERLLGRQATFADLTDTMMNLWTTKLFEAGLSPITVRGYRTVVLALWRAAYELHFLDTRPGRIRKIKITPSVPECWSTDQLVAVVEAFRGLSGSMQSDPKLERATFWTAFVLVAYYTALRFGDLATLRWDQVRDGQIVLKMSKTGDVICCSLPLDAAEVLDKLRSPKRTLVFGQLMNRKNSKELFRRVLRAHGLPGSIKWLRRTSATLLERTNPGAARVHLGHRTHGLAYKHYVDPRLLQDNKPLPPSIDQLKSA